METTVDAKYYTPELEEFHIGFEYEFQGRDGYWNPQGWEAHTIVCENKEVGVWKPTMDVVTELYLFYGEVDKNSFRVKYLDKEDVESLGFKPVGQKHFQSMEDESKYIIKEPDNRVSIYEFNSGNLNRDEGMPIVFNMSCKNKSKLKSILKDVGVLCL